MASPRVLAGGEWNRRTDHPHGGCRRSPKRQRASRRGRRRLDQKRARL